MKLLYKDHRNVLNNLFFVLLFNFFSDLSGNQIEYIEKDALSRLQHIQKLYVN